VRDEDDWDLEARLHDERHEARAEFVQTLAADVRSRHSASARSRPRVTLAFALSFALLVTAVAFGGVGAASNALHSSTSSLKSAVDDKQAARSTKHATPAAKQYSAKVAICYPVYRWTIKYKWIAKHKWVWKTEKENGRVVKRHVKVSYLVKVRYKVKSVTYKTKLVSAKQVARLVAKGAIYPVPEGGCPRTAGT
jgi:hypothetical protein